MQEIFNFIGDVIARAEFWALSTTGFGVTTLVSLLWNNRTQASLLGQKVIVEGLKKAVTEEINKVSEVQAIVSKQAAMNLELKEAVQVLNANIYILAQAANIGVDNKELIAKNYAKIASALPEVTKLTAEASTTIAETSTKLAELEEQSGLDELIAQVK